jgi:predicted transcriptional regulator
MSRNQPERRSLSRREREIVNVIFALGNRASVEDIRSRLADPPGDSSVRVLLARLERKEVVRRLADGVRNLYTVRMSPAKAKQQALHEHVRTFFDGSFRRMLMSMVQDGSWSDEDLEALRDEIDRVRQQRRRS